MSHSPDSAAGVAQEETFQGTHSTQGLSDPESASGHLATCVGKGGPSTNDDEPTRVSPGADTGTDASQPASSPGVHLEGLSQAELDASIRETLLKLQLLAREKQRRSQGGPDHDPKEYAAVESKSDSSSVIASGRDELQVDSLLSAIKTCLGTDLSNRDDTSRPASMASQPVSLGSTTSPNPVATTASVSSQAASGIDDLFKLSDFEIPGMSAEEARAFLSQRLPSPFDDVALATIAQQLSVYDGFFTVLLTRYYGIQTRVEAMRQMARKQAVITYGEGKDDQSTQHILQPIFEVIDRATKIRKVAAAKSFRASLVLLLREYRDYAMRLLRAPAFQPPFMRALSVVVYFSNRTVPSQLFAGRDGILTSERLASIPNYYQPYQYQLGTIYAHRNARLPPGGPQASPASPTVTSNPFPMILTDLPSTATIADVIRILHQRIKAHADDWAIVAVTPAARLRIVYTPRSVNRQHKSDEDELIMPKNMAADSPTYGLPHSDQIGGGNSGAALATLTGRGPHQKAIDLAVSASEAAEAAEAAALERMTISGRAREMAVGVSQHLIDGLRDVFTMTKDRALKALNPRLADKLSAQRQSQALSKQPQTPDPTVVRTIRLDPTILFGAGTADHTLYMKLQAERLGISISDSDAVQNTMFAVPPNNTDEANAALRQLTSARKKILLSQRAYLHDGTDPVPIKDDPCSINEFEDDGIRAQHGQRSHVYNPDTNVNNEAYNFESAQTLQSIVEESKQPVVRVDPAAADRRRQLLASSITGMMDGADAGDSSQQIDFSEMSLFDLDLPFRGAAIEILGGIRLQGDQMVCYEQYNITGLLFKAFRTIVDCEDDDEFDDFSADDDSEGESNSSAITNIGDFNPEPYRPPQPVARTRSQLLKQLAAAAAAAAESPAADAVSPTSASASANSSSSPVESVKEQLAQLLKTYLHCDLNQVVAGIREQYNTWKRLRIYDEENYTCRTCGIPCICTSCALHCHLGHDLLLVPRDAVLTMQWARDEAATLYKTKLQSFLSGKDEFRLIDDLPSWSAATLLHPSLDHILRLVPQLAQIPHCACGEAPGGKLCDIGPYSTVDIELSLNSLRKLRPRNNRGGANGQQSQFAQANGQDSRSKPGASHAPGHNC